MRLGTVLTPPNDRNLRWAAQCGVTDLTIRYPGPGLAALVAERDRIAAYGLRVSVVEGHLPIDNIKLGNERRDDEIALIQQLVRDMGRAGIPILCYNFMAGTDWVRTQTDYAERGGAWVTRFDLDRAHQAVSLRSGKHAVQQYKITAESLWSNLQYFLERVVPVAEEAGVVLAMHPDDPPLDEFLGRARIMNNVQNFERLVAMVPSAANAICFCQGTFAEMGADIPSTIRRLGKYIRYVHFRDIRGTREHFAETFHDNGPTDMFAAMCAYREIGFDGPMRPDHVPQLFTEEDGEPGYTMLGRLFAYGYMRGLMQAAETTVSGRNPRGLSR